MFGWCWHNWGKWTFTRKVIYRHVDVPEAVARQTIIQLRECSKCGKVKSREVET